MSSGFPVHRPFNPTWLPWTIHLSMIPNPHRSSNTMSMLVHGSMWTYHARYNDDNVDGAYMEWDVALAAGTWELGVLHQTDTYFAMVTPSLAGVDLSTFDGYAASSGYNVRETYSGIAVASSGKVPLRLRTNGKHASSSGRYMMIQKVALRRTA